MNGLNEARDNTPPRPPRPRTGDDLDQVLSSPRAGKPEHHPNSLALGLPQTRRQAKPTNESQSMTLFCLFYLFASFREPSSLPIRHPNHAPVRDPTTHASHAIRFAPLRQ